MRPSVIVLTFNSAETLAATLEQARKVSDDLHVVDSFSTDDTVAVAEQAGARVVQHPFANYGAQRNWAIDTLPAKYPWQLHLDADEVMDDQLVRAIQQLPGQPANEGFLVARYLKFLGRVLRHGGMSPTWHLRLFRAGAGRCEDRKYDQHFYLLHGQAAQLPGSQLPGSMIDDVRMTLSEWTARHNRWSDSEVAEQSEGAIAGRVQGNRVGNPIEKKRYWRQKYNAAPLFVRPFALFFYRYFVRLGFLDGSEGFIFWVLQTFWFRFLIDAKLFEHRKSKSI
jgi:glycosyltransferase involved in cell wall biosynthesis